MTEKEKKEEAKKGSFWKGVLQFVIFFIILGVSMVWSQNSLLGVGLFLIGLFRYCFVSYTDKNPVCDKDILGRIKSSKNRWLWFVIVGFLRGWMMVGSYQGEGSEKIRNFQNNVSNSMEQGLDDLEQGVTDVSNDIIQDLGEMENN